ncbi:MAG: intracellular septation protein [Ulvibacter sp.]|jgi:intracellular septation protein
MEQKQAHKNSTSSFLEILPSFVFIAVNFLSSDNQPLLAATQYLIISTLLVILAIYLMTKKISKMALISGVVLTIFGGLTIFSGDELFIKIKPTIVNVTFALILLIGNLFDKLLLAKLFGNNIKMSNINYKKLTNRFILFFLFLALLNELVWRNFSTDFWVAFKVFGMLSISVIFTISQAPFIIKNQIEDKNTK